jgi:hypothetical protein
MMTLQELLENFGGAQKEGRGSDMRIFNKALLARQASRLLQRPDSLCAWVL